MGAWARDTRFRVCSHRPLCGSCGLTTRKRGVFWDTRRAKAICALCMFKLLTSEHVPVPRALALAAS